MIGKGKKSQAKINRKKIFHNLVIAIYLHIHKIFYVLLGSVNIPIGKVHFSVLFIARRYHVLHKIEIIILYKKLFIEAAPKQIMFLKCTLFLVLHLAGENYHKAQKNAAHARKSSLHCLSRVLFEQSKINERSFAKRRI